MPRRSRKFCFTWNNYPPNYADLLTLDRISARYICYGKEVAPTTGTPHLQGFVYFDNGRELVPVRRQLLGCDVRIANGTIDQNVTYCSKDGALQFTELGDRPLNDASKGIGERARWTSALEAARLGRFEDIDAQIFISHYSSIRRIHAESRPVPSTNPRLVNFWIWGDSGCGKSRGVREKYPEIYPKPLNKWWDCYTGQREFILDDVDPTHGAWLGGLLKQWTDHYPFVAEIKGRSEYCRPLICCVTSQYELRDVFSESKSLEALSRRFTSLHFPGQQGLFVEPVILDITPVAASDI